MLHPITSRQFQQGRSMASPLRGPSMSQVRHNPSWLHRLAVIILLIYWVGATSMPPEDVMPSLWFTMVLLFVALFCAIVLAPTGSPVEDESNVLRVVDWIVWIFFVLQHILFMMMAYTYYRMRWSDFIGFSFPAWFLAIWFGMGWLLDPLFNKLFRNWKAK
jgi:hypothetical protein